MTAWAEKMLNFFRNKMINRQVRKGCVRLKCCAVFVGAIFSSLSVAKGYVPGDIEASMLKAMIRDDLLAFAEGRETYAATALTIPMATASEVARAYAEDLEAADLQFQNKRVLLSGIATAVKGSEQGQVLVVFDVPGTVLVRARPRSEAELRALALRPGDPSVFFCAAADKRAGTIDFTDWEFGDDFGRRTWETMMAELDDFYQGNPVKDVWAPTLAINFAIRATQMPVNHGCMESIEKCQVSSRAVGSLKGAEDGRRLKEVIQRFRDPGRISM